jgi:alanine racemase
MDMSLVDVTALRGRVALGDEVVLIGRQGGEAVSADAMAERLGTINYEVVTCIGARVPRVVASPAASSAADALD